VVGSAGCRKGGKGTSARSVLTMTLRNVFSDENDDDNPIDELLEHGKTGADDDLEDAVLDALSKLDDALMKCPACGKNKFCKINKYGVHVNLTFPQRSAWAAALISLTCIITSEADENLQAAGSKGITYMKPPLTNTFAAFHHSLPASDNPHKDNKNQKPMDSMMEFSGMNAMGMQMMMTLFMLMMKAAATGMQSFVAQPRAAGNPQTPIVIDDSSLGSQLSDMVHQVYPSICDFLTTLDLHYPNRQLLLLIRNFEDEDYFHIH
jgi:hypothetical protein